ncbi:TetR/AcrR family transcriptional regulator [uncultured Microbulbifer sp.]|uniref:TetR/AcrR family transcriptional regulator n=1 Tax=uncultured Microbulbifer sp. TaxID=348147 RepID=UPI00261BD3B0|nr:TetR/AcrR family transcriptional regulator [uncultured Microbulbifer sp.]
MTTKAPVKKHRGKSEPRTPAERPSGRRNREHTEQLLLDACERLLVRDGPDGIGVNNVVEEAGVGKELIYRYFGGLPGLVKAWLLRSANWPTALELVGGDVQAFAELSLREQFRKVQHNYIYALRSRPVITRIMASELMAATEVTVILEDASDKIARELTKIFRELDQGDHEDIVSLSFVFYCMTNYLCMRAVTSPHCFGMDLSKDKSWQRIEGTIDRVIDRFLP